MDILFLNDHAQLKNGLNLKKTSVKTLLNNLFKTTLADFLLFFVETLFLNGHAQLKNKTKLKK